MQIEYIYNFTFILSNCCHQFFSLLIVCSFVTQLTSFQRLDQSHTDALRVQIRRTCSGKVGLFIILFVKTEVKNCQIFVPKKMDGKFSIVQYVSEQEKHKCGYCKQLKSSACYGKLLFLFDTLASDTFNYYLYYTPPKFIKSRFLIAFYKF